MSNTLHNQVKTDETKPLSNITKPSTNQNLPSKPDSNQNDTIKTKNIPQQSSKIKVDSLTDEDDDGGVNPKKTIKKKQEKEDKKKNKDELKKKKQPIVIKDLVDEDDDGGISNQKQKIKQPKATKKSRFTVCLHYKDEDEDEDGGISKQKILEAEKKKQESKEKKTKPKPVKHSNDDDEDEDGGISKQKILAAEKKKQASEEKKTKPKPKPVKLSDDDEDEDGGISKQKQLAAEKKKQASKEKKTKPKPVKHSDDDDDGSVPKPQESSKKEKVKKPQKVIPKEEQDDDEDEDGGRIVKTYDTVKMIIPSKKPVLHNPSAKKKLSSDSTDDGTMRLPRDQKDAPSTSYETTGRIVLQISHTIVDTSVGKTTDNSHHDTNTIEEKHIIQTATSDSSTSDSETSCENHIYLLRASSYRKAQHRSPPAVSHRSKIFTSLSSQSNTNDDDSHHHEATNDKIQPGFINRLYSVIEAFQSLSNKQSGERILTQEKHSDNIKIETDEEKKRRKRRKIARNRWFLAYTLIHNHSLSDLRKEILSRLISISSQNSTPNDEQLLTTIITNQESTSTEEAETLRTRRLAATAATSAESQPPTVLRLLSIPSTAEQNVAISSQIIHDTNIQQSTISCSLPSRQTPSSNALHEQNFSPSLFKPVTES